MPGDVPREQLASIAKVADDLDKVLDELFRNAAELKKILQGAQSHAPGETRREAT